MSRVYIHLYVVQCLAILKLNSFSETRFGVQLRRHYLFRTHTHTCTWTFRSSVRDKARRNDVHIACVRVNVFGGRCVYSLFVDPTTRRTSSQHCELRTNVLNMDCISQNLVFEMEYRGAVRRDQYHLNTSKLFTFSVIPIFFYNENIDESTQLRLNRKNTNENLVSLRNRLQWKCRCCKSTIWIRFSY